MKWILNRVRALSGGVPLPASVVVDGGAVGAIRWGDPEYRAEGCAAVDGGGGLVVPGMIDVHIHGAAGRDLMDGEEDSVQRVSEQCARTGCTAFLPTTVSAPLEDVRRMIRAVRAVAGRERGARVAGLHLEGPFLNPLRRGMQKQEYLRAPDLREMEELIEEAGPLLRMVTLAPELPGGLELTRRLADLGVVVAVAHSDATYDQAMAAFDAGATHITHCFNAMPPIHHREPGLVAAALEREEVSVQAIADGVHLHPATVRLLYRLKGPERMALVTDAMQAMGMGDGDYRFGGHDVAVRGGIARLADGTLASSTVTLSRSVKLCVGFGIPLGDAVAMASRTPAALLGLGDFGRLKPGAPADFTVLDEDYAAARTVVAGRIVHEI